MLKSHKFGIGFLVLALASGFASYEVSQVKPVMSAGENVSPPDVTWSGLLGYIASGSAAAMVAAFWKNNQTSIISIRDQVATLIPHGSSATPVSGKSEAVDATMAYYANKQDANAKVRFVNASLAELRDVVGKDNPALMNQLNALAVAFANSQFPVQNGNSLAVPYAPVLK